MYTRRIFQLKLQPALFSTPFFFQSPVPRPAKGCLMRSFPWQIEQISKHDSQPYALRSFQAMAYLFASNSHMLCCECSPGLTSAMKFETPAIHNRLQKRSWSTKPRTLRRERHSSWRPKRRRQPWQPLLWGGGVLALSLQPCVTGNTKEYRQVYFEGKVHFFKTCLKTYSSRIPPDAQVCLRRQGFLVLVVPWPLP